MPGFSLKDIEVADGVVIRVATAGSGTPILLLYGHPHTHIIWRKLGPRLAEHFSVVAADLRGYGDSSKPPSGGDHINDSKHEMAKDQVSVMRSLGPAGSFLRSRPGRPCRAPIGSRSPRCRLALGPAEHCLDRANQCAHR